MKIAHIIGLVSAPFTPFGNDDQIDLELIPAYYETLVQNKVSGAFICGSTGEGVSLTFDEKVAVMEKWREVSKGNTAFKLIMFLGGTNLKECKMLAAKAEEIGVDAVSLTAPFYFKPRNVQYLAKVCQEVASACPNTPFYYYHIPVLSGVNFPMIDLLKEVDDKCPNFVGIKYTHEDFMDFLSCLNFQGGKYDMLWGRDENMLSALVLGAKGAVGSTFNYLAPLYNELIAAYKNGDVEKARSLQQKSIDFITLLGKYGGISTGKFYMKLLGLDCGNFRLPVHNMSTEEYVLFSEEAKSLGFENFKSK